jgi:hypothetical protein
MHIKEYITFPMQRTRIHHKSCSAKAKSYKTNPIGRHPEPVGKRRTTITIKIYQKKDVFTTQRTQFNAFFGLKMIHQIYESNQRLDSMSRVEKRRRSLYFEIATAR